MDENKKHHHFLIAGTVVFQHEEGIGSTVLNGVLIQESQDLPVRSLGKAQQILQLNFHRNMKDEKVKVVDVAINNLVYLGAFTKAEFNTPPEGVTMKEAQAAVNEAMKAAEPDQVQEPRPTLKLVKIDEQATDASTDS